MAWAIVAIAFLVPVNWIRLWIAGDIPKDATVVQFLIGTSICWGVAAALSYFLVVSARGIKIKKAKEDQAIQELLEAPLVEIRPARALIKTGEKAYGAVQASLQETKTVGYSAGTSGMSVRVAKGVTLRQSGTRAHAVKGTVGVADGELVVTDKRIIFAGDRKAFVIPLDDLINTTNYSDGFGFNDSKTTYTLITQGDRERLHFRIALDKVLSQHAA